MLRGDIHVDKASLIQDIYKNYQAHNQDGMVEHMKFIEEEILPLYDNSPYYTVGTCAQLRKIRFVDFLYQECQTLAFRVPESQLTYAVIFSDIALVEYEFNQNLRVPNKGLRSAEFTRYNFGGFLTDQFGYDPHNEESDSIITAVECSDMYVRNGNSDKPRRASKMGSYVYDVNYLAQIMQVPLERIVEMYATDYAIEDNIPEKDFDDVSDKYISKALVYLRTTYGKYGSYRIASKELRDCKELTVRFHDFQENLSNFSKQFREQ